MIAAAEDIVECPKPQRFWGYYATAAVLVVLIVGAILVPMFVPHQETAMAEAVLPDGTILLLKDVTYGTHHELKLPPDPYRLVPLFHRPRIEDSIVLETWEENVSVVVWLAGYDPKTGKASEFDWMLKCTVIDAHGVEITDRYPNRHAFTQRFGAGGNSHEWMQSDLRPFRPESEQYELIYVASEFPIFRCAGDTFQLRVHNAKGKVVATFDVPWQGPTSFPEWEPESFPATKEAGDLAVTLDSISGYGLRQDDRDWELIGEPKILIMHDQRPAEWRVKRILMQDPLGNQHVYQGWSSIVHTPLSLKEPAWKMIVILFSNEDAPLVPAEVWHVGKIPVSPPNVSHQINQSTTINRVPLTIFSSNGSGEVTTVWGGPDQGDRSAGFGADVKIGESHYLFDIDIDSKGRKYSRRVKCELPHIELNYPELTELQELRIQAIDNLGRPVAGGIESNEDRTYWFYAPEEGATEIDFKIIITQGRQVEFLVPPPEAKYE